MSRLLPRSLRLVVTLAESFYLLARDNSVGRTLLDSPHLDLALAGAVVLELHLDGRVALIDGHVRVVDSAPTGSTLLDNALTRIDAENKPRDPDYWVRHLTNGIRASVETNLVDLGVLQRDDHRALGIVPVHHVHVTETGIERKLLDRLQDAVVLGGTASPEIAAVASLVLAVGLERHFFPRSDLHAVRQRLDEIAGQRHSEDAWAARAVRQAIGGLDAHLGRFP